jgi:uncharacterized protein YbjT (DUF2867 family)
MEMLTGNLWFTPKRRPDGTFAFVAPIGEGHVPMVALEDLAFYAEWIIANPQKSVGINLAVATEDVKWDSLAKTFTQVTGFPAVAKKVPPEEYFVSHLYGQVKDRPTSILKQK